MDLDGDGFQDVALVTAPSNKAPIFLGGPNGPDTTADYSLTAGYYNYVMDVSAGDINGDGSVNVLDLQILANVILGVAACPGNCAQNPLGSEYQHLGRNAAQVGAGRLGFEAAMVRELNISVIPTINPIARIFFIILSPSLRNLMSVCP
jgi:hypothetical protein